MSDSNIDVTDYDKKCQKILEEPEIRFAALLDGSGNILAGGFKQGMIPRLSEDRFQAVREELASRVAKRKKDDQQLGHVKYSASRREHVVIMSFPIFENVVMIVAESHINIDRFAYRIIHILGRQWGEFVGE